MRWRVERAGSPGAYAPGWFVCRRGRDSRVIVHVTTLFPTWSEAMEWVAAEIRRQAGLLEACS